MISTLGHLLLTYPYLFTKPVLGLEPCFFNSNADKLALTLLIPANQIPPFSQYQIKQWLWLALVEIIQAEPLWENHTELISFFFFLLFFQLLSSLGISSGNISQGTLKFNVQLYNYAVNNPIMLFVTICGGLKSFHLRGADPNR